MALSNKFDLNNSNLALLQDYLFNIENNSCVAKQTLNLFYVSVFLPVWKILLSEIKHFQNCLQVNENFVHQAKATSFQKESVKSRRLNPLH